MPEDRQGEAAGKEGIHFEVSKAVEDGHHGFTVDCRIYDFVASFLGVEASRHYHLVQFDAYGGRWVLRVYRNSVYARLLESPEFASQRMMMKAGADPKLPWDQPTKHVYKKVHAGWGFFLKDPTQDFTHPEFVDVDGSLSLTFTLLFAQACGYPGVGPWIHDQPPNQSGTLTCDPGLHGQLKGSMDAAASHLPCLGSMTRSGQARQVAENAAC